jgi:hypothetical protein
MGCSPASENHSMNKSEQEIFEIAKAIMHDSPGTRPQKALRHAKDIWRKRGKYKITAEVKSQSQLRTPWDKLPEHIRETIKRQHRAEKERRKKGHVLPTAHFVSGGKVSPK